MSGMGQGNTLASARTLKGMMPSDGQLHFASGGIAGEAPAVPIQVSAGEFVVHPARVAAIGGGDPQAGAAALDGLVARVRQANAQVAQGCPRRNSVSAAGSLQGYRQRTQADQLGQSVLAKAALALALSAWQFRTPPCHLFRTHSAAGFDRTFRPPRSLPTPRTPRSYTALAALRTGRAR